MPRVGRVDKLRAVELRRGGATYREIAAIQGVSPQAINKQIKDLLPNADTDTYKKHRADILARLQVRLLGAIDDESIKKMPAASAVLAACQLYDKERLERGQSTSNMMSVHADLEALRGARREIQEADDIDV